MKTGELILSHLENILSNWEERARQTLPPAEEQSKYKLRDHIPQFIKSLSQVMDEPEDSDLIKSQIYISENHGETRAELEEYKLEDVLIEYSLLRDILIEFLTDNNIAQPRFLRILNKSIDLAMATAGQLFSDLRQKQIEASLQDQKELNAELDRFADVAAHDLRAPMATLSGFLQLADLETPGNEHIEKCREIVSNCVLLLNSLLVRAKTRHGLGEKKDIQLSKLIDDACLALEGEIKRNQAQISTQKDFKLHGDVVALTQTFQNLIANSLKFRSDEAPRIEISASVKNNKVLIVLEDNGVGIEPGKEKLIFLPYKKFGPQSGDYGLGLGLNTCQNIIQKHGGEIRARRLEPHGSRFEIELPLESPKKQS